MHKEMSIQKRKSEFKKLTRGGDGAPADLFPRTDERIGDRHSYLRIIPPVISNTARKLSIHLKEGGISMTGTPSVRGRAFFGLALSMALAAALATAPSLLAQTDVTTSRISGTVRDTDGGALPGVSGE